MMRFLPKMVVAPFLLLAGCDNLLDLRVQTQMMCVPAASQTFTGASAPSGVLPLPGTSTKAVSVDFSKPLEQVPGEQAGLKLDVRLDQVFIRSMTADLSFVRRVKVSLAPGTPSDMLPTLPIGEYERPTTSAGTPIRELRIPSTLNANVLKYLENEPAKLLFTATGRLPAEAFTADVEACVFVQSQATF
jgi:hypothetical protein